jgi:vancomycin resistance protein YoaR
MITHKIRYLAKFITLSFVCLFFLPEISAKSSAPDNILLVFPDRVLTLNFQKTPELIQKKIDHQWPIADQKIPLDFGEDLPKNPDQWGITSSYIDVVNPEILSHTLEASSLVKDLSEDQVEITQKDDEITFSAVPNVGYQVEPDKLRNLVSHAMDKSDTFIRVPAQKVFSPVKVTPELKEKGIQEIIAIGESNFRGSSWARRHNIVTGAKRFNGHIIPQGETFSFNKTLGSVSPAYGFVRELVIKGDETEKELGGGVCQVSTTAFRAAFFGGLPIEKRRAHSYAVPYYKPAGLDAAIYLGVLDFQFTNDTPGDILIQTFVEGNDIYFVFYGTRDDREVTFSGPFISGYRKAPAAIIYETEDLAPGETEIAGEKHDGFRAEWIRRVHKSAEISSAPESFVSVYRPWPARILRGKEKSATESMVEEPPKKDEKKTSYPAIWESYQKEYDEKMKNQE